jgi:hypothetical protein
MEDIGIAAIEGLAVAIRRKRGIDGILRQILSEEGIGNRRPPTVVNAVGTAACRIDPFLATLARSLLTERSDKRSSVAESPRGRTSEAADFGTAKFIIKSI